METSYREHHNYRMEVDALHTWIISTSEMVESLTQGIDTLPKEQLEFIIIKLNVIAVTSALFKKIKPVYSGPQLCLLIFCSVEIFMMLV